jgi:hypothetical protein
LYDRAIRINHEYLADNGVINDYSDIKNYTDILLGFISCSSNISLTSGSNNSFTKLRLMMMKSRSSSYIYGARIAITLCMVTVFFLLLSFKESYQPLSEPIKSFPSEALTQSFVRGVVLTEDGKPLFEPQLQLYYPIILHWKPLQIWTDVLQLTMYTLEHPL